MIVPDNLTFAANTQATYNVIEASCKLGVRKVRKFLTASRVSGAENGGSLD